MSNLDLVLELARAGYYLAPVTIKRNPVTGRKMPLYHGKWRDLSTRNTDHIRQWAAELGPDVSWCIDCAKTGIVVVDLDVKPDLDAALWWSGESLPLGAMLVDTPSGGLHSFWRTHPVRAIGNSTGAIAPGVDVRGDGGHVYAPGSRVIGDDDAYTPRGPIVPVDQLGELPDQVVGLLDAGGGTGTRREPRDWVSGAVHDRPWVERTCKEQLARVRSHLPASGTGFRGVLMGAAMVIGRAVAAGVVDRDYAENRLIDAAAQVWGHADAEDYRWIADGLNDGEADPWTVVEPQDPPVASVETPTEARPDSSWRPIDLAALWDGEVELEQAGVLHRTDGQGLLYRGRTHSLYGESESGKSWAAQICAVEELKAGGRVLYLDFESDAAPIVARLRALGVTRDQVQRLVYVRPDGPRDAAWLDLLEQHWAGVVIDGVTVAIASEGQSTDSTDEAARWLDQVPRKLEVSPGRPWVITIDHVTKARDARGRFAIGSQHKLAAISGAAYMVRVAIPFGRGQVGEVVLRITKDRPGAIRPNCGPPAADTTAEAARLVLDATDPMAITYTVNPWSADSDDHIDPYGMVEEDRLSWRDMVTPLPKDIISYSGNGKSAILDLARFMRARADGKTIGQSCADAQGALKAAGHAPKTVQRAWDALFDMGYLLALGSGQAAARGHCLWVHREDEA